jgi:hypothetical protein
LQQDRPFVVHKGSLEKYPKAQLDHVPIVSPLVLENVQRPGDVAVTVVATYIVHPLVVDPVGLENGLVPLACPAGQVPNVDLEVPGGRSKGHHRKRFRSVGLDGVGATEIVGPAHAVGNSQMPNKGQECRDRVEGRPQYAKGQVRFVVDIAVVVVARRRHFKIIRHGFGDSVRSIVVVPAAVASKLLVLGLGLLTLVFHSLLDGVLVLLLLARDCIFT